MSVFNRTVVILLCLVLMFGAAAVTALAWGGPEESIDWLRDAATWLEDRNTDGTKFIITVGTVVTSMMALTVLIIQLYPRSAGQVKVTDLQVGDAVLSTAAVAQRVEEAVTRLPNVVDARAIVKAKRKGVAVSLDLHVDPEADLASAIDDASEATRAILTEKVHVTLVGPPHIRVHYRELRLRGRTPRRRSTSVASNAESTPPEPVGEAAAAGEAAEAGETEQEAEARA